MEKDYEELVEGFFEFDEKIIEARKKAKKFLSHLEKAKNFTRGREENLKENLAFYEGSQYELAKYSSEQPWVVHMRTPYASLAIDTRIASLIANDYKGEFIPSNAEDTESVQALSDFVNDEWDRLGLDDLITESIGCGAVQREAYIHTFVVDKKIKCDFIDPAMVYLDPEARKWEDVDFIIIPARERTVKLCHEFPEFAKYLKAKASSQHTPDERGEIYVGNDYTTSQESFLTSFTVYWKSYEEKKPKIKKYLILEDILVQEEELSSLTRFPIAQFRWKAQRQSCYGLSLMDDLISLQKAVCSIESSITNTAIAYSNPTLAVREGCGLDPKKVAKVNGAPGVVYKVKGNIDDAIKPIIKPSVDATIVSIKQDYVNSIDRIAGITNQYLGSIGTSGNTAEGSRMAIERSKIIEANVNKNLKEFLEQQTMILAEYVLAIYGGKTVNSRVVTKSKVNFIERKIPKNIKTADFNFHIDMDTKTKFSKEREKEMLIELYQMENQYDSPIKAITILDILSKYNLSNYDEIKERYERIEGNSADDRAQLIQTIVTMGGQYGVPQELMTLAISEIVGNKKDTPYLDQVMQVIEQKKQEFEDQQQQVIQQSQASDEAMTRELQGQGLSEDRIAQVQAEQLLAQAQNGTDLLSQLQGIGQAQSPNQVPQNENGQGVSEGIQNIQTALNSMK